MSRDELKQNRELCREKARGCLIGLAVGDALGLYGAAANLERGIMPPLSGEDNAGNYDDGAAMRIAPIGIICAGDPERAAEMAEIDAQVTHYRDGIWAAQAVAASVAAAMVDASTEEIIETGLKFVPNNSWLGRALDRAMKICAEEKNMEQSWGRLHAELWTSSHSASAEAIPQAYALFRLTNGDFRRGLFWGANFGRDADTIGSVVGALSGAKHGLKAIPPDWIEKVRKPSGVCLEFAAREDISAIADELANLIV